MWQNLLIIIVICFVVVVSGLALATVRTKAKARLLGSGQFISSHAEPKFKIVSIATGRPDQLTNHPQTTGSPDSLTGFNAIQITENPTGICKLTGNQVKDCTCDRHGKGTKS